MKSITFDTYCDAVKVGVLYLLYFMFGNRLENPKNEDFRIDIIVSKLVAAIFYETCYEAEKAEHEGVYHSSDNNKLEVPETNVLTHPNN